MSLPLRSFLPLLLFSAVSVSVSPPWAAAAAAAPLCLRSDLAFLGGLAMQCPASIELQSPTEVDGASLDSELTHGESDIFYSVLFYASWCPFSSSVRPVFDILTSMFPQVRHLLVEESAMMPSILSRYGIHSFPTILLSNRTTIMQYHGSKDLNALVKFYKENTGIDPIAFLVVDQPVNSGHATSRPHQIGSPRELISKEPYLVFGVLFIVLKIVLSILPGICDQLRSIWIYLAWRRNLHVLSELSQLLGRMLHMTDFNKLRSTLKFGFKTRNLRKGANNARAWASTLTSVSLGESSSSRLVPSDS